MLQQGDVPIVEEHLEELVREGQAAGRLRFVLGATAAVDGRRVRLPVCADAPGRRRLGRPLLRRGGGRRDRPPPAPRAPSSSTSPPCPVGSTLVVERVLGRHDVTVVSNPDSSVKARRCPTASTPSGSWSAPTTRPPPPRWANCSPGTHAPLLITDAATAETIKYASQCLPGHQAQLRQRRRQPVRGGRRRRPRRHPRPRLRQAHRLRVPEARARVGRQLPAQGHPRPGPHRRQAGYDFSLPEGRHRRPTTSSSTGW